MLWLCALHYLKRVRTHPHPRVHAHAPRTHSTYDSTQTITYKIITPLKKGFNMIKLVYAINQTKNKFVITSYI